MSSACSSITDHPGAAVPRRSAGVFFWESHSFIQDFSLLVKQNADSGKIPGRKQANRENRPGRCPAQRFYLSSRHATPGVVGASSGSLASACGQKLAPFAAPPLPTKSDDFAGTPTAARYAGFIYPAGTPRRAAPCPPGTRGRRRRRWRCGSFCRRSPAGPRRPRSHRRPQW